MEQNDTHLSKYEAALAKYNTNLSDADVQARVAAIIAKKVIKKMDVLRFAVDEIRKR